MAPFLTETDSPCLPESTLCFRLLLLMCVVLKLFHHRSLSAPEELASGDVIGKLVKSQCPKGMNAWKRRKHKMEKASRGPWIEHEHSPRATKLRVYTRQVNVRSKAVFPEV